MHNSPSAVFARSDTLFGVCEAFGQDLGFNPFWLRLGFAVMLLWNPAAVVGGYAAAGAIVFLSRSLYPDPRRAPAARPEYAKVPMEDAEPQPLAVAA